MFAVRLQYGYLEQIFQTFHYTAHNSALGLDKDLGFLQQCQGHQGHQR